MKDTDTIAVLSVPVKITVEQIKDLLCNAIEGGSNYWCDAMDRFGATREQAPYRQDVPFVEGAYLEVLENEEEGDARKIKLDLAAIQKGLEVFAEKCPKHFADLVGDNADAETGDCFLQCCCFGEVIYG